MTEPTATEAADLRAATVERYSRYAHIAMAGGTPLDSEPDGSGGGCFGAAGYDDADGADVPAGALRASLGCGNPLAVADLGPGEVVLDLGSGAGLDVLLSARRVGPGGTAYGLDASLDMIRLARAHAEQARLNNVEFLQGDIEDVPLPDNHVDVVISNCVINLSADKPRVLAEAFRVLRPGGRLGISDVIAGWGLDPAQRCAAERRVGCAAGTVTGAEYRSLLTSAGFVGIRITTTNDAGGGLHSAIIQAVKPARAGDQG